MHAVKLEPPGPCFSLDVSRHNGLTTKLSGDDPALFAPSSLAGKGRRALRSVTLEPPSPRVALGALRYNPLTFNFVDAETDPPALKTNASGGARYDRALVSLR